MSDLAKGEDNDERWQVLETGLTEELGRLTELVDDPDSDCPQRTMRRARRDAIAYVLDLMDTLDRWEFL